MGFLSVLVSFVTFRLSSPKIDLVVNNKDNRVFMFWNYQSDSCPLEIFALKALLLGLTFVLNLVILLLCFLSIFCPVLQCKSVPCFAHSCDLL